MEQIYEQIKDEISVSLLDVLHADLMRAAGNLERDYTPSHPELIPYPPERVEALYLELKRGFKTNRVDVIEDPTDHQIGDVWTYQIGGREEFDGVNRVSLKINRDEVVMVSVSRVLKRIYRQTQDRRGEGLETQLPSKSRTRYRIKTPVDLLVSSSSKLSAVSLTSPTAFKISRVPVFS